MKSAVIYCPHLGRDISGLLGAVPDLRIFEGIETARGEDGCLEAHKAIVREAQANGDSAVFVVEDDCMFTKHFTYQKWCDDAAWAQAHGYGAMTGGVVHVWKPKLVREGLIAVDKFCSAHCICYFESGYDAVLRAIQPFDISIGECGVRPVVTWPFVAVQRPSFSGILRTNVDYVPLYTQYEQLLAASLGLKYAKTVSGV